MKVSELTKVELKTMSYTDIAYLILKEGNVLNTAQLFKKVCGLLEYSDEEYSEKIGDFYTSLTTDSRFLFLESAEWDLRDNHVVKIEVDDEDEDEESDDIDYEKDNDDLDGEEKEDVEEEDLDAVKDDEDLDDDDTEDDLEELSIVDEEESN